MDNRNVALVMSDLNTGVGVADLALSAVTGHSITGMLGEAGVRAAALDGGSVGDLPAVRSSHHLLADRQIMSAFEAWGIRAIIPFKTSRRVELQAQALGVAVLAPPAAAARRLENKLELPLLAQEANVVIPKTWPVSVHSSGYMLGDHQHTDVEFPAVLQPSVGFAGQGTIPVADEHEAHEAARAAAARGRDGDLAKLTQLVRGVPLTINGCVLDDGTVLSGGVARQLTGIPDLSRSPMTSCGNDWDPHIDSEVVSAAREVATRVGATAYARGLRGMFGVDLIATDEGSMVLIEVNPRWTASLAFALALQSDGGQPTLLDALPSAFPRVGAWSPQAQERADLATHRFSADAVATDVQPTVSAASILLFSRQNKTIIPQQVAPGLYQEDPFRYTATTDDNMLLPLLQGRGTGHSETPRAIVIPRPPTAPVGPDNSLARVLLVGRTAGAADGRSLTDYSRNLMAAVEHALV